MLAPQLLTIFLNSCIISLWECSPLSLLLLLVIIVTHYYNYNYNYYYALLLLLLLLLAYDWLIIIALFIALYISIYLYAHLCIIILIEVLDSLYQKPDCGTLNVSVSASVVDDIFESLYHFIVRMQPIIIIIIACYHCYALL